MNPQQVAAIRANRLYIVDTLEPFVPFFATHFWVRNVIDREEKEKVQSAVTSREQLVMILEILQRKQGSWDIFLEFLVDKNLHPVAEVLREAVSANSKDGETDEPEPKRPERSPLAEFAFKLAQYYQLNYAHLPTMGESHTHVNDVWVPLQIDGRREDHLAADRIDHVELLSRLQSDKRHNVALIKGDPGIGKTTLAKKIAYDWAVNYRSTTAQQFSLVLAVPLRSAGKSNQFDLLAIDYCFSVIELEDVDKAKLVREVRQLKSQLLIILDGLDEYRSYSESPFMILFAAPFQHSTANCTVTPPMITFKLIITSRPYACKRANEDFVPLRFVILPLDNVHLSDFVNLHCQTPQGAAKVTEYLNVNPHLAIQVPLILTFVCFLADSVQEIPTNMTSLYDILIRQMMRREVGQGKLAEPVNMRRWKESKLIKTASKLAYRGYANYSKANVKDKVFKYEFSDDSLDKCHVTNDSFICGFLLPKFDFAKERLMAEFPHRSIQEFFAALQYYQLMLSGRKKAVEEIYNLIINVYQSQIGRFFFGICSNEGQFANLTEWLNPSALYPGAKISPNTAISGFGASLVDCSCEENRMIGQRLFESLGTFEETMLRSWDGHIQAITTYSLDCSGDFREGVHFEVIRRNTVGHPTVWVFACNRQSARLMGVRDELPSSLEVMFDTIDVLIWTIDNIYDASQLEMAFGRLKSFSLVKALLLRAFTAVSPEISVTYFIRYNRECGSKLTCFQFGYDVADRQKLLAIAEKEQFVSLTVDERNEKRDDDGDIFRLMKVTVCDDICQSTLVCFLMGLALLEDNDFVPIRFIILPRDADHMSDFVNLHCLTAHGAAKVSEYLKTNVKMVIPVPLILTFVCYLADSVQEIPTNMTSLYDSLIRQMLRREAREDKLAESINVHKWKDSNVMRTTGELAYHGCADYYRIDKGKNDTMYEFSNDSLEKCHVTNDSFICGFLLHKFDFAKERLMAEFPHRSIQEFFAALHCYQLMLSGSEDTVKFVYKMMRDVRICQFCRFFFGICCIQGRFADVTEWLNPSSVCNEIQSILVNIISGFGMSLSDCSSEENRLIGQTLYDSLGQLKSTIARSWHGDIDITSVTSLDCSDDFVDAVHFVVLRRNTAGIVTDWFFGDRRKSARLVYVKEELTDLLEEKFEKIDLLIWENYDHDDPSKLEMSVGWLKSLPIVKSFVFHNNYLPDISVTLSVSYDRNCESKLTYFRFVYAEYVAIELLRIVKKENLISLTVDARNEAEDSRGRIYRQLNVSSSDEVSQTTLIFSLMHLALLEDIESKKKRWW